MKQPNFEKIPILSSLSEEQLERLRKSARRVSLKEGELLHHQGDVAEYFYYLVTGRMKLFRLSQDGEEKVIEIINQGQIYAEAVMFMEGATYPVNGSALVDTEVIGFEFKAFLNILKESPQTSFKLLGAMSQRLHLMLAEVDKLTLQNATYRLVSWLLRQLLEENQQSEVSLTTSKQVLASRLSIKPETLSRLLQNLSKKGLISVQAKSIRIHDPEQLKEFINFQD